MSLPVDFRFALCVYGRHYSIYISPSDRIRRTYMAMTYSTHARQGAQTILIAWAREFTPSINQNQLTNQGYRLPNVRLSYPASDFDRLPGWRFAVMPPRRALLDDDEDFPMAGAARQADAYDNHHDAAAAAGPITLDFGAPALPPETLFQQLVRHWQNERHAPDILPVQAEELGALLDHIRRQVYPTPCSTKGYFLTIFLSFFFFGWDVVYRQTLYRRYAEIQTRPRRSTRVSCSYRPKSSASNLSFALTFARGCTKHAYLPFSRLNHSDNAHFTDRKVRTVHRGYARDARKTVPDGTGPCETARAFRLPSWFKFYIANLRGVTQVRTAN
jgi:hypothetical protein